jgi:hypothetical protein
MAITNAQQYQQLVNKPADGKRPGYRGDAAYGASSRSEQATSIGQAKGATGLGGGASLGDGRDRNEAPVERPSQINEMQRELALDIFKKRRPEVNIPQFPGALSFVGNIFKKPIQKFADFTTAKNRDFFEDVIRGGKIEGLNFGMNDEELEQAYQDYMSNRMSGAIDAYGNPIAQNDGNNQPIIPLTPYQQDVVAEEVDPNSLQGLLANRMAYRFMADGGRAGFMGGGMPYEGGIMDLESARQMYGLGKLVKKATGAIKKIVKSPVGKAALLYFGGNALMNKSGGLGIKDFLTRSFLGKEVSGGDPSGRGRTGGIFQFMKDNPLLTIAGGSTLAGLLSSSEDEDEVQPYYRGPGLDIDAIRRNPYGTKGPAFGFYAEGGDVKEPVAKNTMRLLDMNGMEKDYRADGGFVPIGRMERADDVPARLSKNEFVFTADAVRNAGDGDIDKGAEVMYNMMKNLEAGGDISEESQGLNGARDMFQTSKRLEEVL